MSPDEAFILKLAEAISAARLEALIVDSTAAALHGAPVMTLDVDLLVRDTPRNREKLVDLSARLGATRPQPISELTTVVEIIGAEMKVDILFDSISGGLSFHALRARSERIAIGKHSVLVASLADIIRSKKAAGRLKDKALLPILEATLRVKREVEKKRQ
ncbi:MAG: hypothetical protein HYY84_10660 [Deltaproteobacteria bacterium]|nr:hypothetical protein [Deltaproteobacteria bacterium]